ncbi:hypothetical protein ACFRAE_09025 [Sphingobacterium sp. HJSM2_6]|uniref:hypothetical protein n=1 Tax=Sphingobacterium sp. HJSM2_6 TaxID=3366264 RepID=UPI003BCB1F12
MNESIKKNKGTISVQSNVTTIHPLETERLKIVNLLADIIVSNVLRSYINTPQGIWADKRAIKRK